MIICPFLPYVKVTVFGVASTESLIGGDGIFFLGIGIIALILGLKGKDTGVMFTSIAAGTLTIIEVINFSNAINEEEFGLSNAKRKRLLFDDCCDDCFGNSRSL